jgi:uncharacterized 2Fe-2S/4Fe-4S cluster protein (DUF4445 family)
MPTVTCLPAGKQLEAETGSELLPLLRRAGLRIETPCGGEGVCGECAVRIIQGEVDTDGGCALAPGAVAQGFVLACQTRLASTPVTVQLLTEQTHEQGKLSAEDDSYLIRRDLLPPASDYDPLTLRQLLQVAPARADDGLGDLDRLERALVSRLRKQAVVVPLSVLRTLADAVRARDGRVTVTLVRQPDRLHVLDVQPGDHTRCHLAAAVDLGTTNIAVQLIDLHESRILATRSAHNQQVDCGLDVISRINYARRAERLEELRERAVRSINQLLAATAESVGVAPEQVVSAVVSGNTTMNHLLLGLPPEQIRLDPYTPTLLQAPALTARELGLHLHPEAWITLSPNSGSYVGGDIAAGLLCTDLATDSEALTLFIDIGTNGEIVLGNRDFLLGCACSAGPAFEGGSIDCGMSAGPGAIESVLVDPDTGEPHYRTIGRSAPRGICGSGMIELVANLFAAGWLDRGGKLARDRACPWIEIQDRRAHYAIARAADDHGEIYLGEHDLENIP